MTKSWNSCVVCYHVLRGRTPAMRPSWLGLCGPRPKAALRLALRVRAPSRRRCWPNRETAAASAMATRIKPIESMSRIQMQDGDGRRSRGVASIVAPLVTHSHHISPRVSELLAERDAANVLILPTFSVPLMTRRDALDRCPPSSCPWIFSRSARSSRHVAKCCPNVAEEHS